MTRMESHFQKSDWNEASLYYNCKILENQKLISEPQPGMISGCM